VVPADRRTGRRVLNAGSCLIWGCNGARVLVAVVVAARLSRGWGACGAGALLGAAGFSGQGGVMPRPSTGHGATARGLPGGRRFASPTGPISVRLRSALFRLRPPPFDAAWEQLLAAA
jgi:hypothetical protein